MNMESPAEPLFIVNSFTLFFFKKQIISTQIAIRKSTIPIAAEVVMIMIVVGVIICSEVFLSMTLVVIILVVILVTDCRNEVLVVVVVDGVVLVVVAAVVVAVVVVPVGASALQTGSLAPSSSPGTMLKNHFPCQREQPPGALEKFCFCTAGALGSRAALALAHSSNVANIVSELHALLGS